MSVNTIYGINGVGKDTVANKIEQSHQNITITSASRILMYLLGITASFSTHDNVSREQYKQLEAVPQKEMRKLEESTYKDFVKELGANKRITLVLSHLVFALYLDKKTTFLTDRFVPDWYLKANSNLIQLTARPETILQRRISDMPNRERLSVSTEEIQFHQSLCDKEWNRIKSVAPSSLQLHTIENENLEIAVDKAEHVIFK